MSGSIGGSGIGTIGIGADDDDDVSILDPTIPSTLVVSGLSTGAVVPGEDTSKSFRKDLTAYRVVDSRAGDTLQIIALREMGDASLWYDLAQLNNLLPPYITDDPALVGPRVLRAGGTISIPSTAPAATGVADAGSVFGTDIALVDGQMGVGPDGDFLTVSGAANVVQAIKNRLATRPGELLYHPLYGCRVYDLLGDASGPTNMQLAAAWVSSAIKSDPRIADARGTVATITGDQIAVQSTAITVDGKHLPIGV